MLPLQGERQTPSLRWGSLQRGWALASPASGYSGSLCSRDRRRGCRGRACRVTSLRGWGHCFAWAGLATEVGALGPVAPYCAQRGHACQQAFRRSAVCPAPGEGAGPSGRHVTGSWALCRPPSDRLVVVGGPHWSLFPLRLEQNVSALGGP